MKQISGRYSIECLIQPLQYYVLPLKIVFNNFTFNFWKFWKAEYHQKWEKPTILLSWSVRNEYAVDEIRTHWTENRTLTLRCVEKKLTILVFSRDEKTPQKILNIFQQDIGNIGWHHKMLVRPGEISSSPKNILPISTEKSNKKSTGWRKKIIERSVFIKSEITLIYSDKTWIKCWWLKKNNTLNENVKHFNFQVVT